MTSMRDPKPRRRRQIGAAKPARLFLLVVSAGPPGEGPAAARRTLIVFATGPELQAAATAARAELLRLSWDDPELQGTRELPADPEAEPEPYAQEAIRKALASGFAFIVYL